MYFVCVCVSTEVKDMKNTKSKVGGAPVPASAGAEGKGGIAKEKDYMGAKVEKTYNEKNAPVRWAYEWDAGDIKAEIYRVGQCLPSDSDNIVAELRVSIANDEGGGIPEKYLFCRRLEFMGEHLFYNWGAPADGRRQIHENADGKTWSEAFAALEKTLLENIRKLFSAIEARKKALEEAER
jgi:hypothetical protein